MTLPPPAPTINRDKYVGAIAVLGIIVVVLGTALSATYSRNVANTSPAPAFTSASFTWVEGKAETNRQNVVPRFVEFVNQNTGSITSGIFRDDEYQLYLPSGKLYSVNIQYYVPSTNSYETCPARNTNFTPIGSSMTVNFQC